MKPASRIQPARRAFERATDRRTLWRDSSCCDRGPLRICRRRAADARAGKCRLQHLHAAARGTEGNRRQDDRRPRRKRRRWARDRGWRLDSGSRRRGHDRRRCEDRCAGHRCRWFEAWYGRRAWRHGRRVRRDGRRAWRHGRRAWRNLRRSGTELLCGEHLYRWRLLHQQQLRRRGRDVHGRRGWHLQQRFLPAQRRGRRRSGRLRRDRPAVLRWRRWKHRHLYGGRRGLPGRWWRGGADMRGLRRLGRGLLCDWPGRRRPLRQRSVLPGRGGHADLHGLRGKRQRLLCRERVQRRPRLRQPRQWPAHLPDVRRDRQRLLRGRGLPDRRGLRRRDQRHGRHLQRLWRRRSSLLRRRRHRKPHVRHRPHLHSSRRRGADLPVGPAPTPIVAAIIVFNQMMAGGDSAIN